MQPRVILLRACYLPALLLLLLTGCAPVNLLRLQDAETMPAGVAKGGGFIGVGPNFYDLYKDSTRSPGPIAFMFGGAAQLGLTEQLDIGGNVWMSSLPFFELLIDGRADLGTGFDAKFMLTPRDFRHKLALTGSISGHYALATRIDFGNAGYGGTWTAGSGLIYSYSIKPGDSKARTSLYLSLRADRLSSSYFYDTGDSVRRRNGEMLHAKGISYGYTPAVGLYAGGGVIEVAGTFVKNPWTGKLDWALFVGLAFSGE